MFELVEIFESLQGEGRNMGRPCVFIRFAGCNLSCEWCDTDCRKRFELTLKELMAELVQFKSKSVILTGGEPTMVANMPELIAALKERGYWIGVETNGLESPPWLQFVDYVAVSPKAAFAERYESDEALTSADEVRIVAESDDVVEFCKRMRERIAATDYYVSPCDHNGEIDFATAKSLLAKLEGWSLSVQLHKILGFR